MLAELWIWCVPYSSWQKKWCTRLITDSKSISKDKFFCRCCQFRIFYLPTAIHDWSVALNNLKNQFVHLCFTYTIFLTIICPSKISTSIQCNGTINHMWYVCLDMTGNWLFVLDCKSVIHPSHKSYNAITCHSDSSMGWLPWLLHWPHMGKLPSRVAVIDNLECCFPYHGF
jgi:hypothetical protein